MAGWQRRDMNFGHHIADTYRYVQNENGNEGINNTYGITKHSFNTTPWCLELMILIGAHTHTQDSYFRYSRQTYNIITNENKPIKSTIDKM